MKILGVETSCDETAAAVVENGTKLLSNVVSSSVKLHQKYGGVVPEIAAREQVKVIIPVIKKSLSLAKTKMEKIDAVAVTFGPGLVGSLLVGVETAKTLALIYDKPLVPVNHLIGHIYANWIGQKQPNFPLVALIVSGGHTDLICMKDHKKYQWLGGTKDDACGEAFDKIARFLGLGYPGGPEIEKASQKGDPNYFAFPRPLIEEKNFDFSFSGLKTAVVNLVKAKSNERLAVSDIAASFQKAVVDVLVAKTVQASQEFGAKEIVVGGGVAANLALRDGLKVVSKKLGFKVRFPPVELSIDNAAMIASAAYFDFKPEKLEIVQAQPGLYF